MQSDAAKDRKVYYGFSFLVGYLTDKAAAKRRQSNFGSRHGVGGKQPENGIGVCVLAAALLVTWAGAGSPAEASEEPLYDIDIPSINAADALNRLAEQTGAIMLFPYDLAESRQANAVVGRYTLLDALDLLLQGTGLSGGLSDKRVISISPAGDAERTTEEKAMAPERRSFGQKVAAALASVFVASGTAAQEDDKESGEDELPIEEILVTGSRIRGAQNASPVVTITRQEIDRAGFATVEEIVDRLPQNFGAGASLDTLADPATNRGNVVGGLVDGLAGGTSVNLRGLGASSTLVLLNGRRMSPSGRSARFTSISSIPVTAIERVEVLTDGASAIYGSDAIGGVINFILRDDYKGAETRLRYGSDGRGDTSSILFGQSFGNAWDSGSILLSYEYFHHDALDNRARSILSTNDLSRFGGTDRRSPGGNPANIVAGGQTFAIPAGQDGTSLSPADFDPSIPPNLDNQRSIGNFLPEQERHSVFLRSSQNIGKAELFSEVQFSQWERETRTGFGVVDVIVPEANPFFVDPTGTGLTTVTVDNYSFEGALGLRKGFGEIDSFGGALGVRFDIAGSWNAELVSNWSKEKAVRGSKQRLDIVALTDAVNQTAPDLAFNPFGDGSNTNPAVLDSLVVQTHRVSNESENELWSLNLDVDGKVFDLSGGSVQVATGIEFREESLFTVSDPAEGAIPSDTSRAVLATYTEVFVPLVGKENGRPGLQRLEVSVAGRYEDYDDFSGSANPKVGLVWSPIQTLTLRGTYGTSFRAPALFDLDVSNPNNNDGAYVPEVLASSVGMPFPILFRLGGNEDLKAEEAATWTAGFQWNPELINSFSLDVTYFNVDFEDRIDLPGASVITGTTDPRFATLLTLDPTPEQIAAVVDDPRFKEDVFGFFTPREDLLSGAVPVGGILDLRKSNLAQSVVTGIDLQLSYDFETALGSFGLGLNGNYLFDFKAKLIDADPLIDEVDTYGRPVDFSARGDVTWSHNEWSFTGFVNYKDGYTDNVNDDPPRSIDSWTTIDLTVAYDTGDREGLFSDTRLLLTIENLFNEDPPFVNTIGGLAYDSANANALGRFLSLQITKDW